MKEKKPKLSRQAKKVTEAIAKKLNNEDAKEGVDLGKLTKELAKRRLEKNKENEQDEQNEE